MELTADERRTVERGRDQVRRSRFPRRVREDLLDSLCVRADYSPCDPDELCLLTAEVSDDEDWTLPEDPAD